MTEKNGASKPIERALLALALMLGFSSIVVSLRDGAAGQREQVRLIQEIENRLADIETRLEAVQVWPPHAAK